MFADNQIFAAPMAGITDLPFRRVIREFSPGISLMTEMISCHSLVGRHKNCLRNFDDYRGCGHIGAQIFGADVNLMADAARILRDAGATWIDINMGCPVPKVATRAGAGAHLMRDHKLAGRIMSAVVNAVDVPVSVKTRLGWDEDNMDWGELVHVAAESGVRFVSLHGRTRAQLYVGPARHPRIENMPIPIIANGDIATADDIQRAQDMGYGGAMIGRAMMGRPWIFSTILGGAGPENVGTVVLRHLEYAVEYYGARTAIPMFRKHAAWYSSGMPDSAAFRIRACNITDASEMKSAICEFWGCVQNI